MEYKKVTLSNLSESTAQEVFDHVVNSLQIQNEKSCKLNKLSSEEFFSCVYRVQTADKVLRCAAGWLIADDEYDPKFENELWSSLVQDRLVPVAHALLITNLQGVHDCSPVDAWPGRFIKLAEQFDLDPKVVV